MHCLACLTASVSFELRPPSACQGMLLWYMLYLRCRLAPLDRPSCHFVMLRAQGEVRKAAGHSQQIEHRHKLITAVTMQNAYGHWLSL